MRSIKKIAMGLGALIAALLGLYGFLWFRPSYHLTPVTGHPPQLSHVFLIVMENHSIDALSQQDAPYIHRLIAHYGYDSNYHGVTHVSLPNYLALLSGRTDGTHSDNPNQSFSGPTLVSQMNSRHIRWQGVMQSLPYSGYSGNWYPEPAHANPTSMPKNALYAKKHDPFMLFPTIIHSDRRHIVPLTTLIQELQRGDAPRVVWITPNLCSDMHGQPVGSSRCPINHPVALVKMGDRFLSHLIKQIMSSPSWTSHSIIVITWDESETPRDIYNPMAWKRWLSAGPDAPKIMGIPVGGGSVPLIMISYGEVAPVHITVWADHYNLLKTIEAGLSLPYLGHAANRNVQPLTALMTFP